MSNATATTMSTAWPACRETEQAAFLAAHPDLYEHTSRRVRLASAWRIRRCRQALPSVSLDDAGFASPVARYPDLEQTLQASPRSA